MSQFGHVSQGASDHSLAADTILANQKACGFNGVIHKVSIYLSNFAVSEWVRIAIYSDSGADAPDIRIGQTDDIEGTGIDGWVTAEFHMPVAVASGTSYWIAVLASAGVDVAYDTDGSQNYRTISYTFTNGIIPTWAGGSNSTRKYSMYVDTEMIGDRDWLGFKGRLDYATSGDTTADLGADKMALTRVTAVEDLTLVRMGMYVSYGALDSFRFGAGEFGRMVIYSDNGDYPDELLAQTDTFEGGETVNAYYYADLQSPLAITNGTIYWLGWMADSESINLFSQDHDSATSFKNVWVGDTFSDGPDDPANSPPDSSYDEGNASIFSETNVLASGGDVQQGVFVDML